MTCIVGLVEGDEVWIGGDSSGVSGWDMSIRADQKVWEKPAFAFGFAGSFRMGQLLRYSLNIPRRHPDDDLYEFMVKDFVDAVRDCLKHGGWATKESEQERGGQFLVGHAGRLFRIEGDYQVGENVLPFDAIGCGEPYALASLWTTDGMGAEERVRTALECAETFSAGVSGPFEIVRVSDAAIDEAA